MKSSKLSGTMMGRIIQKLTQSDRILIASHANPDGDAIGSTIALGLALKHLRREVTIYNESPIPTVYRFLTSVNQMRHHIDDIDCYEAAVILDCGDLSRIGNVSSQVNRIPAIINIDHHITNTAFGDLQLIDVEACATAEIVYGLIKQMGIPIDRSIATALYTGILTDTGSFRFSNTNKSAFTICMEMVESGVDPYEIARHVYGTYSLDRIKLLNLALDTIEISENGKLSLMAVTREMMKESGTKPEDVDGIINYARGIENIKVAALIHELENGAGKPNPVKQFHVSLRSDGDVDVSEIASAFGGGGHVSAAGFSIESSLRDLKSKLVRLAEKI